MSTHLWKPGLREWREEGPHSLVRHDDLYSHEALFLRAPSSSSRGDPVIAAVAQGFLRPLPTQFTGNISLR